MAWGVNVAVEPEATVAVVAGVLVAIAVVDGVGEDSAAHEPIKVKHTEAATTWVDYGMSSSKARAWPAGTAGPGASIEVQYTRVNEPPTSVIGS